MDVELNEDNMWWLSAHIVLKDGRILITIWKVYSEKKKKREREEHKCL